MNRIPETRIPGHPILDPPRYATASKRSSPSPSAYPDILEAALARDPAAAEDALESPAAPLGRLIHGPEGSGKSSFAADLAARLWSRPPVVLSGPFSFEALTAAWVDGLGEHGGSARRRLESVRLSPVPLDEQEDFLVRLLAEAGEQQALPPLVIDGLESMLRGNDPEPQRPKAESQPILVHLLRAFRRLTPSPGLLVTSRQRFTLLDRGQDLADWLVPTLLHLPAPGRLAALQADADSEARPAGVDRELLDRANLGHLDLWQLLNRLALHLPKAAQAVLPRLTGYLDARGNVPEDQIPELASFFRSLTVESIQQHLTIQERELLRLSSIFEVPVPLTVAEELARRYDLLPTDDPEGLQGSRLVSLGWWQLIRHGDRDWLWLNPRVRETAGLLDDEERPAAAMHLLQLLAAEPAFQADPIPDPRAALQISRLAVAALDPEPLPTFLPAAFDGLSRRLRRDAALELGRQALYLMDTSRFTPNAPALHRMGDLLLDTEDTSRALELLRRAHHLAEDGDPLGQAAIARSRGRAAAIEGEPDEALRMLDLAAELFHAEGRRWDEVMTLGEMAVVLSSLDRLDDARKARERQLLGLQELGVSRHQITVLGHLGALAGSLEGPEASLPYHRQALDLARARGTDPHLEAGILGEIADAEAGGGRFEAALKLQDERLALFDSLGDLAGRADTLWARARVELQRGKINEATGLLLESYHLNQELDRLEGLARVGLDYGQVLWAAGMMGEARMILEQAVESFRRLGNVDQLRNAETILEELTTAS